MSPSVDGCARIVPQRPGSGICLATCGLKRFVMPNDIPAPWKGFLEKLDKLLEEPVRLDCIGGFAAVMGYGLPRATNDLDYRTLDPYNRINDLQRIAGPASALAKQYGVHL